MAQRPFRFLHASDLHLESIPSGVADVPDHLRPWFVEAPYRAAERLFDSALVEEVDFVVLAGDVLNPSHTGPRGPLFLQEQFSRLRQRQISVYWVNGEAESSSGWPTWFDLPDNVCRWQDSAPATILSREGEPLGHLIDGHANPIDEPEKGHSGRDLFTLGLAYGRLPSEAVLAQADYWAHGGEHARRTQQRGGATIHSPGTPQGRSPQEAGPHGVSLVEVDAERHVRTRSLDTDVLRFVHERIALAENLSAQALESQLAQRLRSWRDSAPGVAHWVTWTLQTEGQAAQPLRHGPQVRQVLDELRRKFGFEATPIWSGQLDVRPADTFPAEWYDQDSLLGEFLRAARRCEANPASAIDLSQFLSDEQRAGELAAIAAPPSSAVGQRLLVEAARLGADLLSGEEAQP